MHNWPFQNNIYVAWSWFFFLGLVVHGTISLCLVFFNLLQSALDSVHPTSPSPHNTTSSFHKQIYLCFNHTCPSLNNGM